MGILRSDTRNAQLLSDLKVAKTFWARGKGLLGVKNLSEEQGLWIDQCNSIHTFFMKMTIDCVFLDKKMRIKKIYAEVPPHRLVLPVWGARSVVELRQGRAAELNLQVGEQLHVGA
jgi:uncharacterized membrane protein (UPF0127 family)